MDKYVCILFEMGMANSRDKGKNGEREFCKIMSEIFGGSFVRVPNSGANVGGSNSHRLEKYSDTQGRAFRGDIIPPDHLPNLYVEVKSYADFRFHQLLVGKCGLLDAWLKQALEGVIETDKWFVAFKINLKGWYIVIPEDECEHYSFENYCIYKSQHGPVRVTEMVPFLKTNSATMSQRSGPTTA